MISETGLRDSTLVIREDIEYMLRIKERKLLL